LSLPPVPSRGLFLLAGVSAAKSDLVLRYFAADGDEWKAMTRLMNRLRNLTLSVWQPGTAKPIYRLTTSSMHKERPPANNRGSLLHMQLATRAADRGNL